MLGFGNRNDKNEQVQEMPATEKKEEPKNKKEEPEGKKKEPEDKPAESKGKKEEPSGKMEDLKDIDDEPQDSQGEWVKKSGDEKPEWKQNIQNAMKDNIVKSDSSDKPEKQEKEEREVHHVRPSGNLKAPDTTATLQPLAYAEPQDWLGSNRDPDVMLSVPNLGIDHIGLNVKNLYAHVDLQAQVLDLVKLHVGADVGIEEVDLQINNVRVQAMLKIKLEKVREIVGDVVGLLDNHPEILSNLTGGLGRGLEGALSGKRGEVDQLSEQEKAALRKLLQESEQKQLQESDQKKQG